MRVGIFGGTFDPVHLGHLILAEHCREQASLDEVWFLAAARPPHKQDRAVTTFAQRVEMLSLALAGHQAFRIEDMEKDRPGPSFTADTLELLHAAHPLAELVLVLGADCLPDLPFWHDPIRVVQQAELVFAGRPGWELWPAQQLRTALRLPDAVGLRFRTIGVPQVDISSRDLRLRVAAGRTIRYLVPRAVECYIEANRLYRVS